MKKPLIVLTGPTAVGKTKLSIALAKAVNGEIIPRTPCRFTATWISVPPRSRRKKWMASHIIWWMYWSQQKILTLFFFSRCKRCHGQNL